MNRSDFLNFDIKDIYITSQNITKNIEILDCSIIMSKYLCI